MIITAEIKNAIEIEYTEFKEKLYAGKTLEQRKELDQFFTPPSITIPMIEKFECDDLSTKKILDPTCGSGNLLVACLIAGASIENLYGNDYDGDMVELCRRRLIDIIYKYHYITPEQAGISDNKTEEDVYKDLEVQIHRGNALHEFCLNVFIDPDDYEDLYVHISGHVKRDDTKDQCWLNALNNPTDVNVWDRVKQNSKYKVFYYEHEKRLKELERRIFEEKAKKERAAQEAEEAITGVHKEDLW